MNKEVAIKIILNYIEKLEKDIDKKDKRIKRQYKLLLKKDKQIENLKKDNNNQWEERCKLTFEIEELKIDNDIMKQDLNGNILYKDELEEQYISKQKIKEKIKEVANDTERDMFDIIDVLQELLD